MVRRFILVLLIMCVGSGCASKNQQSYEQPLYKTGVLEQSRTDSSHIPEISTRELENQKPGERPPLDSDEAGLWMAMDKAEDQFKTAGNRIKDPDLNNYLQDIACRLAPEYCNDIRIYVLRKPYFNASMAPNGTLAIWSGLLLRATNEAQVAAVIGHEIGHYLRRHSLQRLRAAVNTSSVMVVVQLASYAAGVGVAGDVAYLAALGSLQSYSRDQEREADGYGLALMVRAGYEPHEAGNLWKSVIKEIEASKDKKFSILLFDSHPPSEERLGALDELADRIVARGDHYSPKAETFRTHILPFRYGLLQDELYLRDFDRTEVLLGYLLEDGARPGELYYFKGELYRLRNGEGDQEKALAAYEKARSTDVYPPETLRALGLLYNRMGDKDRSKAFFEGYLELRPDCKDREMILHMLSRGSQ